MMRRLALLLVASFSLVLEASAFSPTTACPLKYNNARRTQTHFIGPFLPFTTSSSSTLSNSSIRLKSRKTSNNDNDNGNENGENGPFHWLAAANVNVDMAQRDALLLVGFVLGRFLWYDLSYFEANDNLQQLVWFTGTFSSAVVLICYWVVAGVLSKSLVKSTTPLPPPFVLGQILVNVALCCPIWIATEHFLEFGPADIGGPTLGTSIAAGFTQLASAMSLGKIALLVLEGGSKQ